MNDKLHSEQQKKFGAYDNRTIAVNSATPKELKKRDYKTIFKGGNKLKDTPDNYYLLSSSSS